MIEKFKKSGKGKLDYLPQYNHDDRKSEAPIIEVGTRKKSQRSPYKVDKSKVVSLVFRAIYLIMFAVTVVALFKATDGQFLFTDSYSGIHDSLNIAGGSAIMIAIIFLLERLVVYYVENFMA